MRGAAAAGIVFAVASCVTPHGPAVPALPGAGGPAWTEIDSEHFTLWTDAPAARGHELVREMEQHRIAVLGVAFGGAQSPRKALVIALRDADEVAAFIPKQFIAYAWGTPNPVREPVIVLAADTRDADLHIVTHELTHAIVFPIVPNEPRWFAEGFAGYFETAKISSDHAHVQVGEPLDYIAERLHTLSPTPVATLFACDRDECMNDMFYATTWALVAYLANARLPQLERYMQRLAEVPAAEAPGVFAQAFPGVTPDQLDHEVAAWLAHGRHAVSTYRMQPWRGETTEHRLGDGDALAARALLGYVFAIGHVDSARPAIEAALAVDPTNVVARLLEAAVDRRAGLEAARATASAHPTDWRAWWLVAYAARRGPDASDARDRACELLAHDPTLDPPGDLCMPRVRPAAPPSPPRPVEM